MKILNKLFSRDVKEKKQPEDIMKIARIIGPLIDETAQGIFVAYNDELLTEPMTYIVPAIWGAKKEGELTATQKEIHKKIEPVLNEIIESLVLKEVSEAQKFAIGFIIRGYIISKITYMIEMVKREDHKRIDLEEQKIDLLKSVEPYGNA